MALQRTVGNQATGRLLAGESVKPAAPSEFVVQRDTGGGIDIDEDSESYSESEEDERDVPMQYDDEPVTTPDMATLRAELQDLNYHGLADKYGWGPVIELSNHLVEDLINNGEGALTAVEMAVIKHRYQKGLLAEYKSQLLEVSPTIQAVDEGMAAASRMSDYDHVIDLLRTNYMASTQAGYILLAKQYYNDPPDDFPYTDELRTLVETPTWSWLLSDDMQTVEDARRLFKAKDDFEASQEDAEARSIDPIEVMMGGSTKTAAGISQVITVAEGVDILSNVDSNTKGKEMVTRGLEGLFERVAAKAFAPIAIGYDLLKAYKYHKTRRDGYYASMKRSGVKDDGTTDVKPDTPGDIEKIRLGKVAHYAYKKTRRAFWSSIVNMALRTVKWISYAITVLSGGTTAVVTGAIALSADITRALMGISTKLKGFWKAITGKRGAMRKKSAGELMTLALGGNEDAIQTIWDVNPFDEVKGSVKDAWNASGGSGGLGLLVDATKLPKPKDYAEFKESLKSGYYSKEKAQKVLQIALKNTMSST
jgi:hypothetical protein